MKELHYASVETVETDIDDEKGCSSGVVDLKNVINTPQKINEVEEYNGFARSTPKRNGAPENRYSQTPHESRNNSLQNVISPVFPYRVMTNDYENERFAKTIMKSEVVKQQPPMKKKSRNNTGGNIEERPPHEHKEEDTYAQVKCGGYPGSYLGLFSKYINITIGHDGHDGHLVIGGVVISYISWRSSLVEPVALCFGSVTC